MFLIGRDNVQFMLVPKYLLFLMVSLAAIIVLGMKKVSSLFRIISLGITFIVFGILIGIHPSPLCALTKPLARYQIIGFIPPPMIVMVGAMVVFSIIGNKIFCGWICPLGCLQEIVYKISKGLKKIKLSFSISNSVRFSLFALFFIYILTFGMNIYDLFNPFELFHWHLDAYILIIISFVIGASLIYFRPFCHFLCPAGLLTWIFEQTSLFKIHIDREQCTHCKKCIKESPCSAIDPILNKQSIVPDCYACGTCIESCPEDAITFSLK
jgi:polyferredoxin